MEESELKAQVPVYEFYEKSGVYLSSPIKNKDPSFPKQISFVCVPDKQKKGSMWDTVK